MGFMQQRLLEKGLAELAARLPVTWKLKTSGGRRTPGARVDAVAEIRSPDGVRGRLLVEFKPKLSAAQVTAMIPKLTNLREQRRAQSAVVVAEFISELARERLREAGFGYLDLTGNVWVTLDRPAIFVSAAGASRDPSPEGRGVRSLKGPKAARLVRALCDWFPPVGIRQLARRAGTDASYATRIAALLQQDDILERNHGGEIADVRWPDLIRRWAQDYSVMDSNRVTQFLDPRGLEAFEQKLRSWKERYALTAAVAVPGGAEVAPGRLATCYVENTDVAPTALKLRPTESGTNVLLIEPFDNVVFQRARREKGLVLSAVSQCAVDLLTGRGREPAQGEALLEWMSRNEDAWRT